jgi:hypothetical protein
MKNCPARFQNNVTDLKISPFPPFFLQAVISVMVSVITASWMIQKISTMIAGLMNVAEKDQLGFFSSCCSHSFAQFWFSCLQ